MSDFSSRPFAGLFDPANLPGPAPAPPLDIPDPSARAAFENGWRREDERLRAAGQASGGFDWKRLVAEMLPAAIPLLAGADRGAAGAFYQGLAQGQALREQREREQRAVEESRRRFNVQQTDRDAARIAADEKDRQARAAKLAGDVFELSEKARTLDDPVEYERFVDAAESYLSDTYGPQHRRGALRVRAPFSDEAATARTRKEAADAVDRMRRAFGDKFWSPEVQGGAIEFRGRSTPIRELVNLAELLPRTESGDPVSMAEDLPPAVVFEELFQQARGTRFEGREVPRDPKGLPDYREALEVARANGWVRTSADERQAREGLRDSLRARLAYVVRTKGNLGDVRKAMSKAGQDWDVELDNAKRRVERETLEAERLRLNVENAKRDPLFGADYSEDVGAGAVPGPDVSMTAALRAEAKRQLEAARTEAGDQRPVTDAEIDRLMASPANVAKLWAALGGR